MNQANTREGRAALYVQYGELAACARSAAAAEALDNVRRKHLTSATAWERLATIGRGIEDHRESMMLEKLATAAAGLPSPVPELEPISLCA